jgi:hypothetical protein
VNLGRVVLVLAERSQQCGMSAQLGQDQCRRVVGGDLDALHWARHQVNQLIEFGFKAHGLLSWVQDFG